MNKYLLLLVLLPFTFIAGAQNTNISGTINKYAKVTAVEYCGNRIIVDSPSLFQAGGQALIIQMQGAGIDQTNSANYGNITDYASAGNYEIQTIDSILGDTIKLRYEIERTYNPSHSVQLIPMPVYNTATANGVLTCKGWDGNTGGVLLLKADTLILNDTIDITGKGFRGFYDNDSSQLCFGNLTDYFYTDSMHGAVKGEGIVQYPYLFGRGKNANGGGGGNNENTGGGGGGSYGKGGAGGTIVYRTFFCQGNGPGDGGAALVYTDSMNRVFMGGGGGCGHGNNSEGTPGTNGGGICIIMAGTLIGNGQYIIANGFDQNNIAGSDGAGGGGGAGAVLLNVNQYSGTLNVQAHGGLGGSLNNDFLTHSCMGPAGGGGGGVLWVNQTTLPANINFSVPGGQNGINLGTGSVFCPYGVTNGALPGDSGAAVTGLNLPVSARPYIRLTATISNDTTVCNDQQVTLTASGISSDSVSFIWSTGQQTPSVTFLATQTGPYTVSVSDQNGCTYSKSVNVKVYNVSPNFSPYTAVCSPQNVTLTAQNPYPTAVTYAWSNGATTPTITFFADSSTAYSVTVTSDSLATCVAIDTIPVSVGTLSVTFSPALDTAVCPGNPVTLTVNDTATGGVQYNWSNGSVAQSITVSPTTNTTFDVTVSAGAGCTATHSFVINMDFLGSVISPDTTICPNGTAAINVTVPNVNNVHYHWSNGDSTQQISVTASSTQPYTVTVSSSNGCTGTATATVFVDSVKVTVTPAPDTVICPGSPALLTANVSGIGSGDSYNWSNGASTRAITVSPVATQTYTVTATDSLGCTGNGSAMLLTSDSASHLSLHISATPDTTAGPGDSVQLSVTGTRLMSYLWTPGQYLNDSVIQSPIAKPLIETLYCVSVTDSSHCTLEICQNVIVGIPPAEIVIPTAFSPNGDGKNDLFTIPTLNGTIIAYVRIYNRMGMLIFDDNTGHGWDGTFEGAAQPDGEYVCFVAYYQKLYPDNLFHKVGAFKLLR